ncbi:MAG: hypothetical protein ACOYMN_19765, partial [Roseimicrobium sp.]
EPVTIYAPALPTAMTWWQMGQPIDREAVYFALAEYEQHAIDQIAENVDERTGLNLTIANICELADRFVGGASEAVEPT